MKTLWSIYWDTRMGDSGTVGAFRQKPTEQQLQRWAQKYHSSEVLTNSLFYRVQSMIVPDDEKESIEEIL